MFHVLWSILVGFLAGFLAKHFVSGAGQMDFIETCALGIVGSVVGGLLARLFSKPKDGALFHPAGFILSVIGACLVLYCYVKFVAH